MPNFNGHIWYKCNPRTCNSCQFCDGGLGWCEICDGFEGTLTVHCPGTKVSQEDQDLIYNDRLEFENGHWTFRFKQIWEKDAPSLTPQVKAAIKRLNQARIATLTLKKDPNMLKHYLAQAWESLNKLAPLVREDLNEASYTAAAALMSELEQSVKAARSALAEMAPVGTTYAIGVRTDECTFGGIYGPTPNIDEMLALDPIGMSDGLPAVLVSISQGSKLTTLFKWDYSAHVWVKEN